MACGVVTNGLLFLLFCCGLGREANGWSRLSFEDDAVIEKQLRFMNKPVIKTIQVPHYFPVIFKKKIVRIVPIIYGAKSVVLQNQNGDVVDCIDFDKQLAFDHPLLKNQSIRVCAIFIFFYFFQFGYNIIQFN